MAKEGYVDVVNIANGVKRSMNVNSFKLNQKKFRLADGESLDSALSPKKKDAEPAVSNQGQIVKPNGGLTNENVEVKVSDLDTFTFPEQDLPEEFAPPVAAPDLRPEGLLESLRSQYQVKTGKAPDGRWNVSRLTKEING